MKIPTAPTAPAAQNFLVNSNLHHDGKHYGIGDVVQIAGEAASLLVELGVIQPEPAPAATQTDAPA